MKRIFFDNASTTPVAKEVIYSVAECMKKHYSVPAGEIGYSASLESKEVLEHSREVIARSINAEPEEIVFTSGGTEANNLAILGYLKRFFGEKKHVITTKVEHESVLNVFKYLEKQGFDVTYLPVDGEGLIDLEDFKKHIQRNTVFVSIQHANQETGVIQPIDEIAEICKDRKIAFHTDAVQSYLKEDIDVKKTPFTFISLSAHLIHGPKGVGALYIRKGTKIEKIMYGGYNEFDIRPGTENLCGISGFAKAVKIWKKEDVEKMRKLRNYFEKRIFDEIDEVVLNGSVEKRVAGISNISFKYIEGESLLLKLDLKGIEVSTGSACFSRALEASYVLLAMGKTYEESHGSLRFSFSRYNSKEEIDKTVEVLKRAVLELRKLSPLKEE